MSRSVHVAVVPLAVFLALFVGRWVPGPPNEASDSRVLVAGAQVALDCVRDGVFFECGASPAALARAREPYPLVKSAVAPFPLFQYIPAVLLLAAGASQGNVLVVLSLLSLAAYLGVLLLLWTTAQRSGAREWAPALVFATIGGPLLFYASSTFGEMLAGFLILLFVTAVVTRRSWALVAGAFWLAAITKETAFPFLIALGLVGIFAVGSRANRRPQLLGIALGAAAAVLTNALFNLFRFGTVLNEEYVSGANFTVLYGIDSVPLGQRFEFFVGLLLSPNGGLVFFWPLAAALLAAAAVVALRRWRGTGSFSEAWPVAALLAILLALIAGFSSFYQPFGWFSWGSRLLTPWVPALLLLAAIRYGVPLRTALGRLVASRRALLATAAAGTLLALPHVAVGQAPERANDLFRSDSTCPWGSYQLLQGEKWFDCIDHVAWEKTPVLVTALGGYWSSSRTTFLLAAALAAANVGLLLIVRDRLAGSRPTDP